MALSQVPVVPQWNVDNVCVSTPDGGILYVSPKNITYIGELDASPLIKVFQTRQSILSVDVDPAWASTATSSDNDKVLRYFAALGQDNSVQIWDFHKGQVVRGHKAHLNTKQRRYMEGNGPSPTVMHTDRVLMSYMCNRNVLSVDSHDLVIYCVASNTFCQRPMFVSSRGQQITVLSCSPYNENMFAVGTSRGLVQVCDIHRMNILYSLRGHDSIITSLSWTRLTGSLEKAVVMQGPTSSTAKIEAAKQPKKPKQLKQQSAITSACDDMFDIYDYDYLENEFGVPTTETSANKGRALKKSESDDNDFVGLEKPKEAESENKFDFAEACQSLKEDIVALNRQENDDDNGASAKRDEVTLVDCQTAKRYDSTSDDEADGKGSDDNKIDSNESTEGSLELINHSSSSDEVDVDGVERNPKQQVLLHQAEVHATQTLEKNPVQNEIVTQEVKETKTPDLKVADTKETKYEVVETTYEDILLLSGAVDGSIWIWNVEHGGACDSINVRNNSKSPKKLNIEVRWLNSNSFLATTKNGDLNLYSLNNEGRSPKNTAVRRYKYKEQSQIISDRKIVSFCVARDKNLLWCISYNRDVWCHDLEKMSVLASYCCVSTNIATMRECPDDMNKIALGCADRRFGIIDISKLTPTNVHIENFSSRIDTAVLSLAWSPDSKRLAFGTKEGRVGIVNAENPKQQYYLFSPVCGKPIYSMNWEGNEIYIVVNEIIAVYDCNSNNKDAIIIPNIKHVSYLVVRKNFLFVGTQRGHLQVYRNLVSDSTKHTYEFLQDLEITTRYITEIAWNPIDTSKFVVVANTNKIQVLSFDANSAVVSPLKMVEVPDNKMGMTCVKWSNRNETEFLTCGFDGSLRVWQLKEDAIVQTFVKQFNCPIISGIFLPSNEDFIMYSGRSTSMDFVNRTEKQAEVVAQNLDKNKRFVQENVQWAQKVVARSDSKTTSNAERRANRQLKIEIKRLAEKSSDVVQDKENVDITNMIGNLKINDKANKKSLSGIDGADPAVGSAKLTNLASTDSEVFMKNPATLLYLTTKELNKDATSKLSLVLQPNWNVNQKNNHVLLSKLFAKKSIVQELLTQELQNHVNSETKGISNMLMHQMKFNLKDEIVKCIQAKKLTEWHVSVAPSVSYVFWQKCCEAFAEQLLENDCALQAASYMLAIHNETEAIRMLLQKNYHKEALLLARLHLQDDDPLVVVIVDKWITHLDVTGNLSGAALICAMNAQYNRGHDILARMRSITPDVQRCLGMLKSKTEKN